MKYFDKKSNKQFLKKIDESLSLLDQAFISQDIPSECTETLPDLLDQCLALCNSTINQSQEPLRIVIHFGLPLDSPLFSSLEMMVNTRILRLEGESFLDDLRLNYQECKQQGQRLLVFGNYFLLEQAVSTDLLSLLNAQFKVKSMVIVTDPVDSYAVYCNAMQTNEGLLSSENYCQRILDFLKVNSRLVMIQNKNLLSDPERVIGKICEVLELSFYEKFLVLLKSFKEKKRLTETPLIVNFYINQNKHYGLGNFVMCTPTIKALYRFYKIPIPVVFSTKYIEEIYKNWDAIEIINFNDVKIRNLTELFGTNLVNKEIEDYIYIHKTICDKEGIPFTYTPTTYAPKLRYTDNSDYAVIIKGCFPNSFWAEKKNIPDKHYENAINSINIKIKFIGSTVDYNEYLKNIVVYAKKNHEVEVILEGVDQILREINGAKFIVTNDTGWYHISGALNKKMFCFWKDTPFRKNLVPGSECVYSQKGSWDDDFNRWIQSFY